MSYILKLFSLTHYLYIRNLKKSDCNKQNAFHANMVSSESILTHCFSVCCEFMVNVYLAVKKGKCGCLKGFVFEQSL